MKDYPIAKEGQLYRRPDGSIWVVRSVRDKEVDVASRGVEMTLPKRVVTHTWSLIADSSTSSQSDLN